MYGNFSPYQSFGTMGIYNTYPIQNQSPMGNVNQQDMQQGNRNYQQSYMMTFIDSTEEVENFRVNPNSTVLLMDSKNKRFFVKTADNLGVMSTSSYTFTEADSSSSLGVSGSAEDTKMCNITEESYQKILDKLNELEKFKSDMTDKLKDLI